MHATGIKIAQEKVFMVISRFVKEYYAEYSPDVYERTYQLFRSLVKTDVQPTSNGWEASVYFDLDKLDYFTRIVPQGQPWTPYAKPENTFRGESWNGERDAWVLETAMTGYKPHGDYAKGTAIWTESMAILNRDTIELLKQELIRAGIPIK